MMRRVWFLMITVMLSFVIIVAHAEDSADDSVYIGITDDDSTLGGEGDDLKSILENLVSADV